MIKTKNRIIFDNFNIKNYEYITRQREIVEDFSACHKMPLMWNKAKNFSLFDYEGNKWIDMSSGIFVANAGHSNPKIKQAIKESLKKDLLYSFCYNTEERIKFVRKLLSISPSYFNKVILLNSGTEAVDAAYKLAKIYGNKCSPSKNFMITFYGSYHGRGFGSFLSKNRPYSEWSNIREAVYFLDFPNDNSSFLEDSKRLPNANNISCFFIETYQGWNASFLPVQYMKDLYAYAKKNNILVVFDEIQSGFYRTGKLYGYMHYGEEIKPDIICLGKGISSSLPMSAILSTREIVDINKDMDFSGTHCGDPICCNASLANIEYLENEKFQKKLKRNIKAFAQIKRLEKYKNIVSKVNVKGMVAGIIINNKELTDTIAFECVNRGVFVVYTGKNSIKLGPPLTISVSAIKEAFEVIEAVIKEVSENE